MVSPRIFGLLVFYDEDPALLAECVASFAPVVDHLIAIDGAYFLYPGSSTRPASSGASLQALMAVALGTKTPLTLHIPQEPFIGNEVEKRDLSIRLAKAAGAGKDDYLLVFDSDSVVRYWGGGLKEALAEEMPLAATYDLHQPDGSLVSFRCIYRCLEELSYGPAHFVLSGLDPSAEGIEWVYLWGNPNLHQPMARPLDLGDLLKVDHRHRSNGRDADKHAYYKARNDSGAERLTDEWVQDLNGNWVEL